MSLVLVLRIEQDGVWPEEEEPLLPKEEDNSTKSSEQSVKTSQPRTSTEAVEDLAEKGAKISIPNSSSAAVPQSKNHDPKDAPKDCSSTSQESSQVKQHSPDNPRENHSSSRFEDSNLAGFSSAAPVNGDKDVKEERSKPSSKSSPSSSEVNGALIVEQRGVQQQQQSEKLVSDGQKSESPIFASKPEAAASITERRSGLPDNEVSMTAEEETAADELSEKNNKIQSCEPRTNEQKWQNGERTFAQNSTSEEKAQDGQLISSEISNKKPDLIPNEDPPEQGLFVDKVFHKTTQTTVNQDLVLTGSCNHFFWIDKVSPNERHKSQYSQVYNVNSLGR